MPNLENLLDTIAEKLNKEKGETWHSSVDMTYPYEQLPLHELTKKLSNFLIVGESLHERIVLQQDNRALRYCLQILVYRWTSLF